MIPIYKYIFTFILLIISIVISYYYIDLPVALYFRSLEGSEFVFYAKQLTYLGDGNLNVILPLILFLIFRKRNQVYSKIALLIFSTAVISGILVNILKTFFGRFRPRMYFNEHLYGFNWFETSSSLNSFPSGHSTTAIGVWFALSLVIPKYRVLFLTIGLAIVSTRIIVTAHYFSDTIAGGILGIFCALICHYYLYIQNRPLRFL